MALYPDSVQVEGSERTLDDGLVVDYSESGKPRFRHLFSNTRIRILVQHTVVGEDKDTLMEFHENNKTQTFDFDWQGDDPTTRYTCRFTSPMTVRPLTGGLYDVSVSMVVV